MSPLLFSTHFRLNTNTRTHQLIQLIGSDGDIRETKTQLRVCVCVLRFRDRDSVVGTNFSASPFSPSILSSVFHAQGFFPFTVRSGAPKGSAISPLQSHELDQKYLYCFKRGKCSCTLFCRHVDQHVDWSHVFHHNNICVSLPGAPPCAVNYAKSSGHLSQSVSSWKKSDFPNKTCSVLYSIHAAHWFTCKLYYSNE